MRERTMRREPIFDDPHSYQENDDYTDDRPYDEQNDSSSLRRMLSPARSIPTTILILVIIAFVTNALYLQHGNRGTLLPDLLTSMRSVFIGAAPVDPASVPAPPRRPDPALGDLTVASAERALIRLGYFSGAAEGLKSASYREALMRFQKDRRLVSSGELDDATKRELEKMSGLPVD